jgi:hypothetical protein
VWFVTLVVIIASSGPPARFRSPNVSGAPSSPVRPAQRSISSVSHGVSAGFFDPSRALPEHIP